MGNGSTHGAVAGYRELPHTADVALEVWAPDLASLFVVAAHGLNFLAGVEMSANARVERQLRLQATDDESLLVAFLSELVYAQEQDHQAFDAFELQIANHRLTSPALTPTPAITSRALSIVMANPFHAIQQTTLA